MTEIDPASLSPWLRRHGLALDRVEPLAGDVSARRYARIRVADGSTRILAAYPESLRDACDRFRRSTALLQGIGVSVPEIVVADCERGLMLLEDVGRSTLFERRDRPLEERAPHFRAAIEIALRVPTLDRAAVAALNPPLDAPLLWRELRQTVDLYLEPANLLGGSSERHDVEAALERLCAELGAEPAVPCHRDFMCRNLVPVGERELVVLDHQDLRLGPPGYDLASLLNDSFYPPHTLESEWLAAQFDEPGVRDAYHRAAAQRTLKAVGTFAAFAARGDDRHLPLVAPTLARALYHLGRAPETAPLHERLERLWSAAVSADGERG